MRLTRVYYFPGWSQRRLPSMDAEDFETIPSSAEELSISSDGEDEGHNKNVNVSSTFCPHIPSNFVLRDQKYYRIILKNSSPKKISAIIYSHLISHVNNSNNNY